MPANSSKLHVRMDEDTKARGTAALATNDSAPRQDESRRRFVRTHAKARRREGGRMRDIEEVARIAVDCGFRNNHTAFAPSRLRVHQSFLSNDPPV